MPKDKDYTNVPHHLLDGAATSLAYGNSKYGEGRRREASSANDRYNSLVGHLQSYHSGEMRDKESGLLHLDCAAMQLAFLMEAEAEIEVEMVNERCPYAPAYIHHDWVRCFICDSKGRP